QDIKELMPNIEELALKVIDFNYNYNLASDTPNSSASNKGKLTLNNVSFKGKGGIASIPSYKFEYFNETKSYDYKEVDDWGFNKNNVIAWNLNKITHPTGAQTEIQYESDDYFTEAVDY